MNPFALLDRLNSAGAVLSVGSGKLAWQSPRGAMSPDLLDAMREYKPILLAIVHDPDRLDDLRFTFDERMAIAAIDGGLSEDQAEKIATAEILAEIRRLETRSSHTTVAYVDSGARLGVQATKNPSGAPKRARGDVWPPTGDSGELFTSGGYEHNRRTT